MGSEVKSKRGVAKLQKLYSDTLISGSLSLDVGTYNTTLSGSNGGLVPVQVDYEFANKPTFGTSVFNANVNKRTGGTWDIWTLQAEQQTVPNSRGQTWGNSEWIRTLFNYESHLKSGVLSGRELTLTIGEGIGNLTINGMSLDQNVTSSNEFFSFVKTGGGESNSNLAIAETFTMEYGNIFLNSYNGQTLKKKESFMFEYDTFLEIVETPNTFSNSQYKCLMSNSANLDFRLALQSDDATRTINICEILSTFGTYANTLIVGHSSGNRINNSVTNHNNILIGNESMINADGSNNTCIGENIFGSESQKVSFCNTGLGVGAFKDASTNSNYNVAIGTSAGKQANSSHSVWIGQNSGLNSTVENELSLGGLITGKMTSRDDTSQVKINANKIHLGGSSGLPRKNDKLDKLENQVWIDTKGGNVLKIGNVTTGTSYDIIGGSIDEVGRIHLNTRNNQTSNLVCTGNVFTGSVLSGSIDESDRKIHITRFGQGNVEINNILHSNFIPSSLIIDNLGNISIITTGHNTANIVIHNNIYSGDITSASAINNTIILKRKNETDINIANVATIDKAISGGYVDEANSRIFLTKNDGSNISFQANFVQGHTTSGILNTNSNLSILKSNSPELVIPNIFHVDYKVTSNSSILEDGKITFVTQGSSIDNFTSNVNVFKGTITNGGTNGNVLLFETNGSANLEITKVVPYSSNIIGSELSTDGNVFLKTNASNNQIKLYTLTNRIKTGDLSGNTLTIQRYGGSSLSVSGIGSTSSSTGLTNLTKIPDTYKKDNSSSGYRSGKINMTHDSAFSSVSISTLLGNSLSTLSNYGTYQGQVVFEFIANSTETSDSYAINEVELVLNSNESFANSSFYNGLIHVTGSNNGSYWYDLNIPLGYIYDIWRRRHIESRIGITLRLIKNISNYKYYKIAFSNFGSYYLPNIVCINFDYIVGHETDYV